jgi:N-acetylmuramoyl-L-alanine amidase
VRFVAAAVLLPVAACSLAWAAAVRPPAKKPVAQTPWQMAEEARAQLLSIPAEQRTAEDYRTVMDAYRLIYHGNPADVHAPEAIYAVGLLLAGEATVLHEPKWAQSSIGQFEFLRKNYPQSSLRIAALLEEGHIAAEDLRDAKLAREKYAEFVKTYPRSLHVDEAQAALKSLKAGVLPPARSADPAPTIAAAPAVPAPAVATPRKASAAAAASNGVPGAAVAQQSRTEASLAASQATAPPAKSATIENSGVQDAAATVPAHTRSGLATVSAIRHWSTPTYTRVAIDLGDEVQYEAARVPNPDRIYFDLHGTRLAQELSGKSFTVTDDGFLKRIRAAQYSNDMTRVVLDVNDVTDYSAFLLPNPYRLIIDIHGGDSSKTKAAAAVEEPPLTYPDVPAEPSKQGSGSTVTKQQRTAADSGVVGVPAKSAPLVASQLPAMPTTQAATQATSAAVPSTVATRSMSAKEVTALSAQPDQQRATAQPTSQPIAVVADNRTVPSLPAPATSSSRKKGRKTDDLASSAVPGHAADPTSTGERSLVRALGLKIGRIVIDPGHGGHDSGTLGAGGIMEKDVVLDVALRLGKMLHEKLGAEIIYTRSDDTFIPLETRTAIANKAEADLFISVHANSSQDETARGVETYYLNFTSQPDALDVAARENAVSDQSIHQLADLVKKITLKDKIDESKEFASDVEKSLYDGLHKGNDGLKDRGVKKAPFVVLIGANMPSILTEISFVTNSKDAAQLRTPEYRQRVAESIFHGIARYASGLSGIRVAANAKPEAHGE